jgi:hypothetical protein
MLFLTAILAGPRMIWLVNKGSWLYVTRQVCYPLIFRFVPNLASKAPPLGTIWIYTIIQLNLMPAVASLIIVFGLAKFMNWKLVF